MMFERRSSRGTRAADSGKCWGLVKGERQRLTAESVGGRDERQSGGERPHSKEATKATFRLAFAILRGES